MIEKLSLNCIVLRKIKDDKFFHGKFSQCNVISLLYFIAAVYLYWLKIEFFIFFCRNDSHGQQLVLRVDHFYYLIFQNHNLITNHPIQVQLYQCIKRYK